MKIEDRVLSVKMFKKIRGEERKKLGKPMIR